MPQTGRAGLQGCPCFLDSAFGAFTKQERSGRCHKSEGSHCRRESLRCTTALHEKHETNHVRVCRVCEAKSFTLKNERRAVGGGVSFLLSWARGHTPTNPGEPLPSGTYAASCADPAFWDTANPPTFFSPSFFCTPATHKLHC